ncbi:sperm-associated antigen 17 [Elysia marginata]|uniref:Sperm-associated antigen 17 n=1 Tax=Elysia marginata TaxID=1093978 RepID=A0AAV4GS79_9GAST|nr:sperm-associated antigen 17 [Elysia marginata]
MEDMMRQLSEDPRHDGTEAVRGDLNESRLTYTHSPTYNNNHPPVPPSQPRASVLSDRSVTSESPGTQRNNKNGQETPLSYTAGMSEAATVTPSRGVRPHNPTPAHATGQGSPAPVRPHNPTPVHAGKIQTDRPGNPTPKIALGVETPSEYEPSRGEYPMILEHPWEEEDTQLTSADRELARQRALTTNVIGEPRAESVPLPGSIKGGRPGAMPNVKYHNIEDPVRRQVRTSLVAGAEQRGRAPQLAGMRGLICQPEGVNFGVLKEGCTYRYAVMLRNTGVDTCRFKIRQPPPATGLRVIYKPGPVNIVSRV